LADRLPTLPHQDAATVRIVTVGFGAVPGSRRSRLADRLPTLPHQDAATGPSRNLGRSYRCGVRGRRSNLVIVYGVGSQYMMRLSDQTRLNHASGTAE